MSDKSRSTRLRVLVLLSVMTAAFLLFVALRSGKPRLHEPSAQRDARPPRSEFVGNETCAACHADVAEQHATTGHAQTFVPTADSDLARRLDGVEFKDPERPVAFRYRFDEKDGLSVAIPGLFEGDSFPLSYVLGSNQHAQTFLSLILSSDGETVGLEHRVSVYAPEDRLDLTPSHRGAQPVEAVEQFGRIQPRATVDACIGCHTTHYEIDGKTLKNVIPNVDCESCHGPGRQHVANMSEGSTESAINALRGGDAKSIRAQIEVCGKCHRLPKDLDPADIVPGYSQLVRFQPVGLLSSPCFIKSGEQLSCSGCHDPHLRPNQQRARSEQTCLNCHSAQRSQSVPCPVSPADECINCHMPRVEVHPGIAYHDHWIRVHDRAPRAAADRPQE